MKKVLIIALSSSLTTAVMSQSTVPASDKVMTSSEARALNGGGEPTINGIPYSQYKAEQDALKQKGKQVTPASEVPAQFRLKESTAWNGTAVSSGNETAASNAQVRPINSNTAQQPGTEPAVAERPAVNTEKPAGPDIKAIDSKTVVPSAVVKADPKPTATAPSVPTAFRLPAVNAQSWNGRPAAEAATVSPATEKPASRTAAEIEKASQPAADKASLPAPASGN